MNARARPVPVPPSRCAYGHEHFTTGADFIEGGVMVGYSACTACEDLRAHEEAYQEWLSSQEAQDTRFVTVCRICGGTGTLSYQTVPHVMAIRCPCMDQKP